MTGPRKSLERGRRLIGDSLPLRFALVGGVNTLASFLVYLLLVHEGLAFPIANLASLICGITLGFALQGRFTFRDASLGNFPRFLATWAAIYAIQTGAIWALVRAGLGPSIGGLIVFPAVVLGSFVAQRRFVFGRS